MDIQSLYSIFLQHPNISTDTRKIKPGGIFFALKGDHFDGNSFAMAALHQGAAYAVVSDSSLVDTRMIYVEDTLETLQSLAKYHRSKIHIPVIAITGSNGKTTTKELITAVLSKKYKVHATAGNLNNHIGVPLTMLGAKSDVEIIICEMGANHKGEIAFLCTIAAPTHGVITNIGKAHLEGFGSLEGVKKAKGELFEYLKIHNGFAFINADDPRLRDLGASLLEKMTFGFDPDAHPQVQFKYSVSPDTSGFTMKDINSDYSITSSMFGLYNASNMLAAYTIGQYFKVSRESIATSLSGFISGANRSEIINYKGCVIVKDAYNANPSSMELSLKAFAERFPDGWILIGDMKELGETTIEAHQQIIQLVSSFLFKRIFIVGEAFAMALLASAIKDSRIVTSENIETLKRQWNWEDCQGQTLFLKGSRSMHLEYLLET